MCQVPFWGVAWDDFVFPTQMQSLPWRVVETGSSLSRPFLLSSEGGPYVGGVGVLMSPCNAGASPTAPFLAGTPHTLRTARGIAAYTLHLPARSLQPTTHKGLLTRGPGRLRVLFPLLSALWGSG